MAEPKKPYTPTDRLEDWKAEDFARRAYVSSEGDGNELWVVDLYVDERRWHISTEASTIDAAITEALGKMEAKG